MGLTVHHLATSQSERIVWLCEELGIEYTMVKHERKWEAGEPPLRGVEGNYMGTAPFIEDGDVKLGESAAVAEYILNKYGSSSNLVLSSDDPNYAQYLYWFAFANGTLQPAFVAELIRWVAGMGEESMFGQVFIRRFNNTIEHVDDRLKNNKWLAGDKFSAADVMNVFSLSTQRYFTKVDLTPYPNIVRWLQDCGKREAYQRAMKKGDPDMKPLLDGPGPEKTMFEMFMEHMQASSQQG